MDRIQQTDIIATVAGMIKDYPVYDDEEKQNFNKPCFFIKLIPNLMRNTVNVNKNKLSIMLTYFPKNYMKRQIEYLKVSDEIRKLFAQGFPVKNRYLHIDSIQDTRIGELGDILQIELETNYFDTTGYDYNEGYDIVQNVTVDTDFKDRS